MKKLQKKKKMEVLPIDLLTSIKITCIKIIINN